MHFLGGIDQFLGKVDLVLLNLHLRGELRQLRLSARDRGRQALALRSRGSIFLGDLFGEKGLLQGETLQDRRIHVETVGGELRLVDAQEEIALGDLLILRDMDRGDGALLGNENARGSERRRQIPRDRLFSGVTRKADKDDEREDGDR